MRRENGKWKENGNLPGGEFCDDGQNFRIFNLFCYLFLVETEIRVNSSDSYLQSEANLTSLEHTIR